LSEGGLNEVLDGLGAFWVETMTSEDGLTIHGVPLVELFISRYLGFREEATYHFIDRISL
jgi:hypothetical protein